MNKEKFDIAIKMTNELKTLVNSDTWRGTFRHESFTDKFVDQVSRSHFFIDAGAEFGFYTWLALKHMPETRKIALFEPEPERFAALRQILEPYSEVSVYPYALAETSKTMRLYKETCNHSATLDSNLSQSPSAAPEESFEVKTVAMDEFFSGELDSIDIVKMDIEGAEIYALQGMKRLLAERNLHMFMEFHGYYIESCCPGGSTQIKNTFDEHGYSAFTCEGLECTPSGLAGRMYLRPNKG